MLAEFVNINRFIIVGRFLKAESLSRNKHLNRVVRRQLHTSTVHPALEFVDQSKRISRVIHQRIQYSVFKNDVRFK